MKNKLPYILAILLALCGIPIEKVEEKPKQEIICLKVNKEDCNYE